MRCESCGDVAEVRIGWPRCDGSGKAVGLGKMTPVCGACGSSIWNTISTRFSGTEACLSFCIESVFEHEESAHETP